MMAEESAGAPIAGGPEAVTCREADETKLLIPRAAWPIVGLTARAAADHLNQGPKGELVQLLESRGKALMIDPDSKDGPLPGGAFLKSFFSNSHSYYWILVNTRRVEDDGFGST